MRKLSVIKVSASQQQDCQDAHIRWDAKMTQVN